MNKFTVVIGLSVGLLLLALIFWLKPTNNSLNPSVNVDPQPLENVSEGLNENRQEENTGLGNSQSVENVLPTQEFKPKTDWADKTIDFNGTELSYKFGEGNPSEVALSSEQYLPKGEKDGVAYVTPKAEYQLKEFLSDENLPELLNKCINYLNKQMIAKNPGVSADQMVSILDNKDVDIENYLIIDKETGRKMINPESDYRMNDFLNVLNNPLDRSPVAMECFGLNRMQDFSDIQKKFHDLGREYTNTGKSIQGSEWMEVEKNQQQ